MVPKAFDPFIAMIFKFQMYPMVKNTFTVAISYDLYTWQSFPIKVSGLIELAKSGGTQCCRCVHLAQPCPGKNLELRSLSTGALLPAGLWAECRYLGDELVVVGIFKKFPSLSLHLFNSAWESDILLLKKLLNFFFCNLLRP